MENILGHFTVSNFGINVFSGWNREKNLKKKHFSMKKNRFEDYLLIFKNGNCRVVENIFLEK